MADISKIILPNGTEYDIKDASARSGLDNKVDKVSGKGLSTNDYTTTEKNKLSGIAAGAEVNVQADWNVTDSTSDAFIKNKPTIPTDDGFDARLIGDVEIPNESDLDDYTTPGEYYGDSWYVDNSPYWGGNHKFRLRVEYLLSLSDGRLKQTFFPIDDGITDAHTMYWIRIYDGTTWGAWTGEGAFNAKLVGTKTISSQDCSDLNTIIIPGEYYVDGTSATYITNIPPASGGFRLRVELRYDWNVNIDYPRQVAFMSTSNDVYVRYRTTVNSAWTDWEKFAPSESHFTISLTSSSWSSSATTVNGTPYYTASVTASSLVKEYPIISCGSSSTLPSKQEKNAFNLIDYAIADVTNHTITFYAVIKPTINLTINVVG